MKSMAATDVTGCTYIGVTRAYARAYEGHREVSVTSVASVAVTDICRCVRDADVEALAARGSWALRGCFGGGHGATIHSPLTRPP
jgi:hypothetical protein